MTFRQRLLKVVYPVLMFFVKKKAKIVEGTSTKGNTSFYDLKTVSNANKEFDFGTLKNKNVLIVNTASDCGYTNQYDALQALYTQYKSKLEIIAFPANDFQEQEKGTDAEIESFCKVNFGVTFPLMKKSTVIAGSNQNEIFQWLTDAKQNGWNNQQPTWNFSKYLINTEGNLVAYFDPAIDPLDTTITKHLQ